MPVILHDETRDALTDADLQRWRAVPAAVAIDVAAGRTQIDPAIRPLRPAGRQPKLFGRAVTALCEPPDFGAVVLAIDRVGPGEVLVIAAGGHAETAMIGEILGGHLRHRGAAGLICDGAVRDVGELARWNDFSVFARHVTPRGPTSAEGGEIDGPVAFGGRTIRAGDLIIGDDDGLAALGPALARELIEAAEAKLAREAGWLASLAAGRTMAETLGLAAAVPAPSRSAAREVRPQGATDGTAGPTSAP